MNRNLIIGSVMTPEPVCIEAGRKLERAKAKMDSYKIRQLPVTRFGRLAGVLTKQNLKLARQNPFHAELTVADAMEVDPYIVQPSTRVEDVLWDMLSYKLEYAVVAEDETRPLGIFTRQDALKLLLDPPRTKKRAALRLLKPDNVKTVFQPRWAA